MWSKVWRSDRNEKRSHAGGRRQLQHHVYNNDHNTYIKPSPQPQLSLLFRAWCFLSQINLFFARACGFPVAGTPAAQCRCPHTRLVASSSLSNAAGCSRAVHRAPNSDHSLALLSRNATAARWHVPASPPYSSSTRTSSSFSSSLQQPAASTAAAPGNNLVNRSQRSGAADTPRPPPRPSHAAQQPATAASPCQQPWQLSGSS